MFADCLAGEQLHKRRCPVRRMGLSCAATCHGLVQTWTDRPLHCLPAHALFRVDETRIRKAMLLNTPASSISLFEQPDVSAVQKWCLCSCLGRMLMWQRRSCLRAAHDAETVLHRSPRPASNVLKYTTTSRHIFARACLFQGSPLTILSGSHHSWTGACLE